MWYWFEYRAAYDNEVSVELPLIPSARAAPPSGPSSFPASLRAHKKCLLFCQRALTRKRTLWGTATHLSSLSTLFPLTQLAMMMAEATPSPLRERSIFSVGFVPLSSSIGSAPPSTLPRERHAVSVNGR
jgi:hypothetical protein